ncbi:MAG: hypothetical protein E7318_12695 [Clostridiales bacterium]|nr:hypothetical protein [Clostridiales bacterium]
MAKWESLLGLPLETALAAARAWGMEPKVLVTCAPRRKGEEDTGAREGTLRVIRVREGELTVSAFQDGDPRKE